MPRKMLNDEEVETEIKALSASEYVMLARREQRLKYKRRQALYTLRSLEKRGRALRAEGVTIDNIDLMIAALDDDNGAESYDFTEGD